MNVCIVIERDLTGQSFPGLIAAIVTGAVGGVLFSIALHCCLLRRKNSYKRVSVELEMDFILSKTERAQSEKRRNDILFKRDTLLIISIIYMLISLVFSFDLQLTIHF